MIDVPENWAGGIDDLVREAKRWLSTLLPEDRAHRPKDAAAPMKPSALREQELAHLTELASGVTEDRQLTRKRAMSQSFNLSRSK